MQRRFGTTSSGQGSWTSEPNTPGAQSYWGKNGVSQETTVFIGQLKKQRVTWETGRWHSAWFLDCGWGSPTGFHCPCGGGLCSDFNFNRTAWPFHSGHKTEIFKVLAWDSAGGPKDNFSLFYRSGHSLEHSNTGERQCQQVGKNEIFPSFHFV